MIVHYASNPLEASIVRAFGHRRGHPRRRHRRFADGRVRVGAARSRRRELHRRSPPPLLRARRSCARASPRRVRVGRVVVHQERSCVSGSRSFSSPPGSQASSSSLDRNPSISERPDAPSRPVEESTALGEIETVETDPDETPAPAAAPRRRDEGPARAPSPRNARRAGDNFDPDFWKAALAEAEAEREWQLANPNLGIRIVDSTGAGVPGVALKTLDVQDRETGVGETDASGVVWLRLVTGRHVVVVEVPGRFEPTRRWIEVEKDAPPSTIEMALPLELSVRGEARLAGAPLRNTRLTAAGHGTLGDVRYERGRDVRSPSSGCRFLPFRSEVRGRQFRTTVEIARASYLVDVDFRRLRSRDEWSMPPAFRSAAASGTRFVEKTAAHARTRTASSSSRDSPRASRTFSSARRRRDSSQLRCESSPERRGRAGRFQFEEPSELIVEFTRPAGTREYSGLLDPSRTIAPQPEDASTIRWSNSRIPLPAPRSHSSDSGSSRSDVCGSSARARTAFSRSRTRNSLSFAAPSEAPSDTLRSRSRLPIPSDRSERRSQRRPCERPSGERGPIQFRTPAGSIASQRTTDSDGRITGEPTRHLRAGRVLPERRGRSHDRDRRRAPSDDRTARTDPLKEFRSARLDAAALRRGSRHRRALRGDVPDLESDQEPIDGPPRER